MPKQAWNIFVGFLVLAVVAFLGFTAWQYRSQYEIAQGELEEIRREADDKSKILGEKDLTIETLERELDDVKRVLEDKTIVVNELEKQQASLMTEKTNLRSENLKLIQEKVEMNRLKGDLERSMVEQLNSKDVAISELKGKLTVDILNRVLFDTGRSELKEEGKQVLLDVAEVLERYPNRQIHVIGHTDDIPFSSTTGRYRNNWELSAGRATAAVAFLQQNAGVNPKRLAIVGFGEYHPIASNESAEGRAQNRRIAIVIMPEGLSLAPDPPEVEEKPVQPETTKVEAPEPEEAQAVTIAEKPVIAPLPKKPIATGIKPISRPISTTND